MGMKMYKLYEDFANKINEGRIPGFYLTAEMPSGIAVRHGEPDEKKPTGLIAEMLHERRLKKEKVICVACTTHGDSIYAVNESFRKRPEKTLHYTTLKF